MLSDEHLLDGLEQIEERWKKEGKKYSRIEIEILGEKYGWMTADNWERFCGIVLAGSDWFPAPKRFADFYEIHRNDFPRPPKAHVKCDDCKGKGIRYWVQKGFYGDIDIKIGYGTAVAKCSCANGQNWPAYPGMKRVERRKDFVRWVGPSEANVEARANPYKGMKEPGEEG